MSTPPDPDLRATLHRLADATVPLPVDDDLWQRGQAARRRGQALVVAAVLVLVASVGGVVTLVTTTDREARTASSEVPEGGAIPSVIMDIPSDLDVTPDLALGVASAAFVSGSGAVDPVVITAADGVPHRLGLPDWVAGQKALALSPDGRRLAWHQRTDDLAATIAVLDLVSGSTSTFTVSPDDLRLRELSWSPNSSWLAWIGDGGPGSSVGRLQPGPAPLSHSQVTAFNVPDIAVSNEGVLVLSRTSGALFRTAGRPPLERISGPGTGGAGRFSPDSRLLALRSSPAPSSFTYDTDAERLLEHPFPAGSYPAGAVLPLGWVDETSQLLLVQGPGDELPDLVVASPDGRGAATWRGSVGSVDVFVAGSTSLAVDLIPDLTGDPGQELTHDFGDPLAADRRDISWIIGLGVAAAIAVLLGLRWLWRRRLT